MGRYGRPGRACVSLFSCSCEYTPSHSIGGVGSASRGSPHLPIPRLDLAEAELELELTVDGRHCGDQPQVERHLWRHQARHRSSQHGRGGAFRQRGTARFGRRRRAAPVGHVRDTSPERGGRRSALARPVRSASSRAQLWWYVCCCASRSSPTTRCGTARRPPHAPHSASRAPSSGHEARPPATMQLLRSDGARLERRLARVRQVRTVRRTSAPDSSKAQASLSKALAVS